MTDSNYESFRTMIDHCSKDADAFVAAFCGGTVDVDYDLTERQVKAAARILFAIGSNPTTQVRLLSKEERSANGCAQTSAQTFLNAIDEMRRNDSLFGACFPRVARMAIKCPSTAYTGDLTLTNEYKTVTVVYVNDDLGKTIGRYDMVFAVDFEADKLNLKNADDAVLMRWYWDIVDHKIDCLG